MPDLEPKYNDHDLLVALHEASKRTATDINELKINTLAAIDRLDVKKFDSKDFAETWGKMIGDHENRLRDVESKALKEKDLHEIKKSAEDNAKRIELLFKYLWLAMGAIGIVQMYLQFFYKG